YEDGSAKIIQVAIKVDWNIRQLSGPIIQTKYPRPNMPRHGDIRFFGMNRAILKIADSSSIEYRTAVDKFPSAIRGIESLRREEPITVTNAMAIAADLVRLESEFEPESVGPPINIVVISSTKTPVISSLSK